MVSSEKVYSNVRKTGRCFNGAERDGGKIIHIIEGLEPNGFWSGKSLCRTDIGYRGNGWSKSNSEPTCQKCINKMSKIKSAQNEVDKEAVRKD